jgi:hypothetical protein
MTLPAPPFPAALLLALALAAGCARHSEDQKQTSAAERAACDQHAEAVYQMRYPDQVYRADTNATSTRDAPFSGSGLYGLYGNSTDVLVQRYQRDQLYRDCLSGGGGTVGAAPDAPAPEEIPIKPSVP